MKARRRAIVSWGVLALGALAASTCANASNALTSPTEYDSMAPGWQSKFSIEWKVQPSTSGTNIVYGRIHSHYGQHASPFRVLAMALDETGKTIGQRIEAVPGGVPGFTAVYFEVDKLASAASYRVTVWDYTFIEARGGNMQ